MNSTTRLSASVPVTLLAASRTRKSAPERITMMKPSDGGGHGCQYRTRLSNASRLGLELRLHLRALRESAKEGSSALMRLSELTDALVGQLDGELVEPGATPPCVRIGMRGQWFRIGAGEPASLSRRRALSAVLDALAANARASVSSDALIAAGWPKERVLPEAGATRVRTAIATLRRLGLRDLLITTGEGYMLDANVVREAR